MNHRALRTLFTTVVTACSLAATAGPVLGGADQFSPEITWRAQGGQYAAPIHIALLPDGQLLLIGRSRDTIDPQAATSAGDVVFRMTPAASPAAPETLTVVNLEPAIPFEYELQSVAPSWTGGASFIGNDTLYCSGHTFTADGTLLVVGGTRSFFGQPDDHHVGSPYAVTYSGAAWQRVPGYFSGHGFLGEFLATILPDDDLTWRWYSAATRLADSRILVTGGIDYVFGGLSNALSAAIGLPTSPNTSVEIYDPATASFELLVDTLTAPFLQWSRDYTHVFQLPEEIDGQYDVITVGEFGVPNLLSTHAPAHFEATGLRPGRPNTSVEQHPNHATSSLLLPLRVDNGEWNYSNGSILMAGGRHESAQEHSADIYDPYANSWWPTIDFGQHRQHPSTVLLPDGRVLIIAGHDDSGGSAGFAQVLDPANGMALTNGTATYPESRGYHAITALLPDGRVLLGGGNFDGNPGNERVDFRYYSPTYMSEPRPTILAATAGPYTYGQYYAVIWTSPTPVKEIVLIAPASMTHCFDQNQRYVQLNAFYNSPNSGIGVSVFFAPPNARVAPAGDYMMFAVDANRIPSAAKMIRLQ